MKNYEVEYVELKNGETLAYRRTESKNKPLYMLLHGNQTSSVFWQPTMEMAENQLDFIAPDMRGFGDSTYKHHFKSLKELAEDLSDMIDELKLPDLYVVGWSTGGGVALELAAMRPEKIKGVVLLDSVGLKGYYMYKKDKNGLPILTERISTMEEIASDPVQVVPVLKAYETGDREIMRNIWNLVIYNVKKPSPEDYEIYLSGIMKQRNLLDVDYALIHFNITHDNNGICDGSGRIDDIKCPVLIIHGEKDIVVSMDVAEESLRYLGSRATLEKVPDAGHSVITDNLPLFVELISGFAR